MRVLVTGANGFIGRHVVRQLAARGDTVIALTHSTGAVHAPHVTWARGDLFDVPGVARVVNTHRPSHLLHLAWITEPGVYWTSPENARWETASSALFETFAASGGTRVVAAGSCVEYDWGEATFAEDEVPRPATPYGRAKDATRRALDALCEGASLSHAWGRVFFLFGPGEDEGRFVPSLVRPLLRGEGALCRKPSLVRDWLYVEDVAAAFIALLGAPVEGAVNISSGHGVTLGEFARHAADAAGHPELLQLGDEPAAAGEPPRIVGPHHRLAPHWRPAVSLTEGLARSVAWWR